MPQDASGCGTFNTLNNLKIPRATKITGHKYVQKNTSKKLQTSKASSNWQFPNLQAAKTAKPYPSWSFARRSVKICWTEDLLMLKSDIFISCFIFFHIFCSYLLSCVDFQGAPVFPVTIAPRIRTRWAKVEATDLQNFQSSWDDDHWPQL